MTTAVGFCREIPDRVADRLCRCFPCLSDPGFSGAVIADICSSEIVDMLEGGAGGAASGLCRSSFYRPWWIGGDRKESPVVWDWTVRFLRYIGLYLLLFVATLSQYFFTAGSSPGYVIDAMRATDEKDSRIRAASMISKQPATSKHAGLVITFDGNQLGRSLLGSNPSSWTKLVMEMYPPGSSVRQWTCTYCNVVQPPRAKHCHDCDKCVLQFDHHCVWLGTCIGQGNHCRFWWYICEEAALCLWTVILYIHYLKANISRCCYLVLTNQTTYELVRRRRIPYMRTVPERVYPFSRGVWRNFYDFCCTGSSEYRLERLPTAVELEAKSRPYSCLDVIQCRCC
ncbi:S-acyltransferase 10-like protein [Drosera capensis]